jgi:oxalate decarboxylase/phosphoglucose isomerase-like protein (cupin superfamily)
VSDLLGSPLRAGKLAPAGSKLVLAEWEAEAALQGQPPQYQAPLHVHHHDDEAWYVLDGRLKVRVGDEEYEVPAGTAVIGPSGLPHTFWNPDPVPARYLIVMSAQTSAMLDALHGGGKLSRDAMREVFARHGCELLG